MTTKQTTKQVLKVVWMEILKMNEVWRGNSPIYRQKISRIPNDVIVGLSWAATCHKNKNKSKTKKKSNFMAIPKKGQTQYGGQLMRNMLLSPNMLFFQNVLLFPNKLVFQKAPTYQKQKTRHDKHGHMSWPKADE